jgi:hypothetical protein
MPFSGPCGPKTDSPKAGANRSAHAIVTPASSGVCRFVARCDFFVTRGFRKFFRGGNEFPGASMERNPHR